MPALGAKAPHFSGFTSATAPHLRRGTGNRWESLPIPQAAIRRQVAVIFLCPEWFEYDLCPSESAVASAGGDAFSMQATGTCQMATAGCCLGLGENSTLRAIATRYHLASSSLVRLPCHSIPLVATRQSHRLNLKPNPPKWNLKIVPLNVALQSRRPTHTPQLRYDPLMSIYPCVKSQVHTVARPRPSAKSIVIATSRPFMCATTGASS